MLKVFFEGVLVISNSCNYTITSIRKSTGNVVYRGAPQILTCITFKISFPSKSKVCSLMSCTNAVVNETPMLGMVTYEWILTRIFLLIHLLRQLAFPFAYCNGNQKNQGSDH